MKKSYNIPMGMAEISIIITGLNDSDMGICVTLTFNSPVFWLQKIRQTGEVRMDCFKPNLIVTLTADLVTNVVFLLEEINIVLDIWNEIIDLTTSFSIPGNLEL